MKKLAGLLILIALYAGAAFYTGYQGEKNIRQQFALSQQQSEAQGVQLELNRYERGVFFSDVEFTATYTVAGLPGDGFSLSSTSRVQHGPLLFLGKVGVGLFSSVSTVEIVTGDAEADQKLADIFGESIGEIVTLGHFNNSYTSTWTVPAIEYSDEGDALRIDGINLTVNGTYTEMDMTGSIDVGAMDMALADGTHITTTPLTGNFDVKNIAELVNISNMNLAMDTITFRNAAMVSGSIEQIKVVQTQKLVNEKIDTFVSLSAAKVNGPLEITALHYDITLNQLDPAAIQKWAEIAKTLQADPEAAMADNSEAMTELMNIALQEGLQFKLAVGADFMGGSAKMDWVADYQPLTDGRTINSIVDPLDYLLLVNSDLKINVSESIVTQTPLVMMVGQYMDTYITQDGDQYVMHATLKDGVVKVGNTQIPPEMLLALLPALGGAEPQQPAFDDSGTVYDNE